MRGWRLVPVAAAGLAAAAAATVTAVAVNASTSGTAGWYRVVERHPLWWTAVATVAVAGAGLLAWRAQGWYDRRLAELIPAVQQPEPWVVDRPGEVDQVVAALRRKAGGTVGITTAVQGAGGFGKTTVAKLVGADRRVLRRFRGRVHWVTLGRDAGKEALPGLVNGLIAQLIPDRAVTFTDARQASDHLAAVLAGGPRRLLILDDVWTGQQLAAFPAAGKCARLVTTRVRSLTGDMAIPVRVDQMTDRQARALLLHGLPPLPSATVSGLLEETGRWPLLVRLVSKFLAGQVAVQPDIAAAAGELLSRLRAGGALRVDEFSGAAERQLDVGDPDQRNEAVRATIEASAGLLSSAERDRLAELAVFAEDETIPIGVITLLWQATGGMDHLAVGALVARLADLALLALVPGSKTVAIHDVIRDYLSENLGTVRLTQLHAILIDAVAGGLRRAPAVTGEGQVTAWWELPGHARYLRDHLIEHLLAARRPEDAEVAAADLRWAAARLEQSGPAAPYADLALIGTPQAERLRRTLGQVAHLLAPTDPPHSLTDILYRWVSHDPVWGPQAHALSASRKVPALISKLAPPDLPTPALRHTLPGHTGSVHAVVVAPDGTWLATAGGDGSVQVWDAATWLPRVAFTGHSDAVRAMAVAPDGTWLATASDEGTVRVWDAASGLPLTTLTGRTSSVTSVVVAPDGTWLATAGDDGSVQVWDAATWLPRVAFTGHSDAVRAMAVAPDGSWLATTSDDGTARVWDAASGRPRAAFTGHISAVRAVAVAPDGSWVATTSDDGTARVWDAATGLPQAVFSGHISAVRALVVAPDGSWVATTSDDGTARVWDAATGRQRVTLTSHSDTVRAMAVAPDGTWLATTSDDGTARIWDTATGQPDAVPMEDPDRVVEVAFAPDGTWLATAGDDGTARIWDAATGLPQAVFSGYTSAVRAVVVAPDGTWLASAGDDGTARIWDVATGRRRAILTGHAGAVRAVVVAPDGTWLATAGDDGIVRVWGAATWLPCATLTGHAGAVRAMAVAPDGTWLATAGDDRTVRVWDTATASVSAVMRVNSSLRDCAWSPFGLLLAAAGDAGLHLFAFSPSGADVFTTQK